jgi:hypothetical protein
MIQWVLDALDEATTIGRVVIIGLDDSSGVRSKKLVSFMPNQGSMVDNIRAGILKIYEFEPQPGHVLLVSSDIPAITSEMVDWVVNAAMETDKDAYYNVIRREDMERVFPASNRSYIHLKDMEVCGGDMNLVRASMVTTNDEMWRKLIDSRKNALKQAAMIGYDTLLLLLLRWITLDEAVQRVEHRLNITGKGVVCPYPEVGMDVDKPHQFEIVRAYLEKRLAQGVGIR